MIWRPTVNTGFRLVMGSWKIMEISSPRICRSRFSGSLQRSSPRYKISPSMIRPGGSLMRRRMEREVTDLPQPLSPTMASVSPSRRVKSRPSTAGTTPSSV